MNHLWTIGKSGLDGKDLLRPIMEQLLEFDNNSANDRPKVMVSVFHSEPSGEGVELEWPSGKDQFTYNANCPIDVDWSVERAKCLFETITRRLDGQEPAVFMQFEEELSDE